MNDVFDEFAELIGRALATRWLKELESRRGGGHRRRNRCRGAAKSIKPSKRRAGKKGSDGGPSPSAKR